MVETNHHHHHHSPPPVGVPPAAPPPFSGPRGAVYTPAEQLHQLNFCIHSNPSWPEMFILAFQHYIVMLGTTVMISSLLVPRMGGDNGDKARVIQTLLFMGGINTLLQTFLGTRLPTVMGASFAFVIPVLSIIRDFSDSIFTTEHQRFVHTIRAIQGALIVSSFFNIIIGYSKAWGRFSRFFSPVSIVPVVCVVGLGLFQRGFPQLAQCVEIGLPMLILLVITQQYLKRLHESTYTILERFALLLCIGIVWAFAALLTVSGAYNNVGEETKGNCRTDRSHLMSTAPWIKVPYPFQWGAPIFRASHVFGMMGAALVASAESTGTYFAAARLSGATPPPAHVLSRSIGLQGVGMLLDGIFGAAVGTTASVENVGLLGLTHVGSRRVVQISSAFMIFFSIFGKFGAFFASIPFPIFAAIYCVLFGLVAATGISFIQFANNNSMRNLYILGLSLFLGISIPQYFNDFTASSGHGPVKSAGGWFNDILNTIFSSPPTVAMLVGTLLDNTLDARATVDDRGLGWWVPFQNRNGDMRNEEFYSYPIRIHEAAQRRERSCVVCNQTDSLTGYTEKRQSSSANTILTTRLRGRRTPRVLLLLPRLVKLSVTSDNNIGGMKDILLWKKKKQSISVLTAATVTWVALEIYQFNFITVASWVAMAVVTFMFLWGNLLRLLGKEPQSLLSGFEISEEFAMGTAETLRVYGEEGVRWIFRVSAEREWFVFVEVVGALWLLSLVGVVMGMTVPVIYVKYEDQIKRCGERMRVKLRRCYDLVDEKLLRKLKHKFGFLIEEKKKEKEKEKEKEIKEKKVE
ncbi:Reticulon [Macleaya cordata]|uniref:Reticulon-like protein n=1 Tax=Macleaya cordata TaxID=56857 RepID=A0A200QJ42_MACCD|nr:Reticulon [Macleaya cordata]